MDNFEYVKSKVSLMEVVGEELDLKKNGRMYKARCPFHDENTPSFTVYPEQDTFHCYGCKANGTVIDYYMYRENMKDPIETLEFIADKHDLVLEGVNKEKWEQKKRTIQENRSEAAKSYKNFNKEDAQKGIDFLKSRNLSEETRKKFGVGYSITQNAVHIPYLDTYGNIVGHAYRHFDENKPKYMNSAEDEVFRKGELLYGLDKARKNIIDYVFVTEGYLDVLAMYEMGYPQTVAYAGQAITDGQALLLSKYITKRTKIYLIPDNDKTGLKNVGRNVKTLRMKMNNPISVIQLPEGMKDPGDLQSHGLHIDEFTPEHHEMFLLRQELDACLEKTDEYEVAKEFVNYTRNKMIRSEMAEYLSGRWEKDINIVYDFMETEESSMGRENALQNFSSIKESFKQMKAEGSKGRFMFNLQKPDMKVKGMKRSELAYLLGRSGAGKTTFALNFIHNLIFHQKKNVVFNSLELSGANIAPQLMQIHLNQTEDAISDLVMNDDPSTEPFEEMLDNHLRIVDESGQTVQDIENYARMASEQFDTQTDVIVIDYFGYIKRPGRNSYEEYSEIARELKQMAKRLNCLVFVLTQTSRDGGDGSTPLSMDMARDSGAIEESGDYVFGVYRPAANSEAGQQERNENPDFDNEYFLQYLKNRWGGVGKDKLYFEPETKRISNFDNYKSRVYTKGASK